MVRVAIGAINGIASIRFTLIWKRNQYTYLSLIMDGKLYGFMMNENGVPVD